MTNEPNVPKERAIVETEGEDRTLVEYSQETQSMVNQYMPNESNEVKNETMALIEAIKRRAQSEAKGAGELTRDAYLNAVTQARQAIEQNQLFDTNRIEKSMELLQQDAEKNWDAIVAEISSFGDRLADAAKAAWDTLTAPRPNSKP
jgi:predicted negative regulator of RcsB-dependent stress response